MALFSTSHVSCGVNLMWGISGPPRAHIKSAADRGQLCRFLVFSDVIRAKGYAPSGGQMLAKEIEDNKLGALTKSTEGRNPNSGNNIAVWVWDADHFAIGRYLKATAAQA